MNRHGSIGGFCDFVIDFDYRISNYEETVRKLDTYYGMTKRQILRYQSVTIGLFPISSAEEKIADVRSSIYCALAVWGLYQSYRRIDDDQGRAYELSQSAVKCMRGILWCWMRQTNKVEKFKHKQVKEHAIHVKFHLLTGDELFSENEYNHLQLDVVSLYLLILVQMINSGLQLIYSIDETNFIQNLVYYVERAYRTPDFGMWERGTKSNNGIPEIHASSIGMAKAALEAVNGCNLFSDKGAAWSVIYVDIDAHDRNRSIFETLLPRESRSKSTDCSLLPTLSFPAFATHDDVIYSTTKNKIIDHLKGNYGFRRFIRDGFGHILEDKHRRYYHPGEIRKFEDTECEWPIFFIYMIIDGIFKGEEEQVKEFQNKIQNKLLYSNVGGSSICIYKAFKVLDPIVPQFYYLRQEFLEYEKLELNSQPRCPSEIGNGNNLFLWGQSLYLISQLLVDQLLHINELDPIRRYLPSYNRPRRSGRYSAFQGTARDLVVQVVMIAESMRLQAMMATYGIQTQTPKEIEPLEIWSSHQLVKIYQQLGINKKLNLTGRPPRPIGALGTSKFYRILGRTLLTYPLIHELSDFYLSYDMALLIDDIISELQFVGKFWRLSGRPTVCILIREEHMRDVNFTKMLDLLAMLKHGHCNGQKIRVGRLQNFIASSSIDFLDPFSIDLLKEDFQPVQQLVHTSVGYQSLTDIPKATEYSEIYFDIKPYMTKSINELEESFMSCNSLNGQSQLLGIILQKQGKNHIIGGTSVDEWLSRINKSAGVLRQWKAVRYCSSLLCKLVDSISPSLSSILVNGKQVTLGNCYNEEKVLDKPMTPVEIKEIIYSVIAPHDIIGAVLQQEVLLYAGKLIATNPELFNGLLKFRIGWVLKAMQFYLSWLSGNDKNLADCSPSKIRHLLLQVLTFGIDKKNSSLGFYQQRQLDGCLGRVPKEFFQSVWCILNNTSKGLWIGSNLLPKQPIITELSVSDFKFTIEVEAMLNRITLPEYRQLTVEIIIVISTILSRNPELQFSDSVNLDTLIQDAFKIYMREKELKNVENMNNFFDLSYAEVTSYFARAIVNTILKGDSASFIMKSENDSCKLS